MKQLIVSVFPILMLPWAPLQAQTPAPAATQAASASATPTVPAEVDGDRFASLRELADRLKAIYEMADADNVDEIQKLLKTRKCQIARIGGLLDRTKDALNQWVDAEKKYWTVWGEAEQTRVDGQQKTLAAMEQDQARTSDLLENEKRDREELQRRKANLENSKRTAEINSQIDGLIKDIQDSEARLNEAQQKYDSLTVAINNMRASISARLVNIRQQKNRVEAFELDMNAFYEENRKAAQETCNTKQPDTQKTPLPKRGGQQQ